MAEEKKKMGRPLFGGKDVESVLAKLEHAWIADLTDEQACFLAEISMDSLYRYEKAHPEFHEKKLVLKQSLAMKAKKTIANKVYGGDEEFTKWWAERKLKDEFSTKQEIGIQQDKEVRDSLDDAEKAVKRLREGVSDPVQVESTARDVEQGAGADIQPNSGENKPA